MSLNVIKDDTASQMIYTFEMVMHSKPLSKMIQHLTRASYWVHQTCKNLFHSNLQKF